jgi:predicted acetyltransferase
MKIGDQIYGCYPGLDLFTEKTGAKSWVIRLRNERNGALLDKRILIDYTKTEALAVAKYMAQLQMEKTA